MGHAPLNDNDKIYTGESKAVNDILETLADDIKASTVKICAQVVELHHIARPQNEFQKGYNAAVADIALRIWSV
jgi:hypothetical protein